MIRLTALLSIIAVLGFGCSSDPSKKSPFAFEKIVLLDVEGRSGGRDLWIDKDGLVICHQVKHAFNSEGSGLDVTHYLLSLTEEQQSELATLLAAHDFFNIQTATPSVVYPGTVYVIIYVKAGNKVRSVGKWMNHEHKGFDAIYECLLQIDEMASQTPPVLHSKRDWDWHPENFPSSGEIMKHVPVTD